eukprot:900480-Pelagomonas_calceolata.AAC.1
MAHHFVNLHKSLTIGIQSSRAIDWYMYLWDLWEKFKELSGFKFLGLPFQKFPDPFLQESKSIIGFLGSRAVEWHPLRCGQQVAWRERCSESNQTFRIVRGAELDLKSMMQFVEACKLSVGA